MAVNAPADFSPNNFSQNSADISKYISLDAYINEVLKPDNRERLALTYGDQAISTIYGLLNMVGAVKASGTNDSVQWWEDTRLHNKANGTLGSGITAGTSSSVVVTLVGHKVRQYDNVIIMKGSALIRTKAISRTANTFTLAPAATWPVAFSSGETIVAFIAGNDWAQATAQPTLYIEPNVVKRTNSYFIIKDRYTASGSAMTNKSWVTLPDGKQAFYWKGEQDTKKRFLDYIEMGHILGSAYTNSTITALNINGSEGLISALESRGTIQQGYVEDLQDLENLSEVLDQEGGATQYAAYVKNKQLFKISRLAAALNQGGLSYGLFNNSADMAMALDFTVLKHGGREFNFHTWKLLNDPQLLGQGGQDILKGVMIAMDDIKDSKTGTLVPALEINYKAMDGYSREMEMWQVGAANGVYNDSTGVDALSWDYRAEQALLTRVANRHVLIK